jgi:hypothetical protein
VTAGLAHVADHRVLGIALPPCDAKIIHLFHQFRSASLGSGEEVRYLIIITTTMPSLSSTIPFTDGKQVLLTVFIVAEFLVRQAFFVLHKGTQHLSRSRHFITT